MASTSRSTRGTTPTGSRPSAKAGDSDRPTRPASKDSLRQKALKKAEEAPKPDAEEQLKALQSNFEELRAQVTCQICMRLLYQPYTISCGHTYCYSCLCTWFASNVSNKTKKTCPDCRSVVTQIPAPAYAVRSIATVFYSRPDLLLPGETVEQHETLRKEEADIVQQDKDNQDPRSGGLFKGVFATQPAIPRPIVDFQDGVERCPMCAWELEDGHCEQCGLFFDENGEVTWGDSFAGFSDGSERDLSSEEMASEMDMEDGFDYDEEMDAWDEYPDVPGDFMLQRWIGHGMPPQAHGAPRRRMTHSEAGSRRSHAQSIISDMYTEEMDTVEEEDEDGEEDSSMNDFIDDDEVRPASTSRSSSSAPSVTPQPPPSRVRVTAARARRVVESETSSTISSVIEEEDEDEEDEGPIRRGQRNPTQARLLNRANGRNNAPLRRRTVASSTSTETSNEQDLDEDTQALLRADGWLLQHDGPDEEMDEDDMSDGGQTTVGWDATANSNERLRMGGSLTPTADRPRPNAPSNALRNSPIRPPSRAGNNRFPDGSRGLRRRSSVLSTATAQLEDGEADDDNSDLDQDGDVAMAMHSLRTRRSRAQMRSLAALNQNNFNNRFSNRGFSQANPIDLDADDNSDSSQRGSGRYDARISIFFRDHQQALQDLQRPGTLIDLESRSTTPIPRPRTANRNRPSPAPQYSPFNAPAPARLRTPLMDNTSSSVAGARVLTSPPRRALFHGPASTTPEASNGPIIERVASESSASNASSVVLTPSSTTPGSQSSANVTSQAQILATADTVERPPSRMARPPSAAGRRTPGFSPVFPNFPHSNIGLNQAARIGQRNPWAPFVQQQQHGVRPRNSRPVLRDQSSTATLRPVASRVNIRENVNPPQTMRAQASRADLRHQPSRRRLNNQASTRTLRASEYARPPQPMAPSVGPVSPQAPRPRLTSDERELRVREVVNDRMRVLANTRNNPFAPENRRPNYSSAASSATAGPSSPHHVRSNSNESVASAHSSGTANAASAPPGLGRRRSNRNMAAVPPPGVLSPSQGSFSPPSTTYTNTYFRARQGSFAGSSPSANESPLSPNGRGHMVAATGQLIGL